MCRQSSVYCGEQSLPCALLSEGHSLTPKLDQPAAFGQSCNRSWSECEPSTSQECELSMCLLARQSQPAVAPAWVGTRMRLYRAAERQRDVLQQEPGCRAMV